MESMVVTMMMMATRTFQITASQRRIGSQENGEVKLIP